jgi:CelD/BcsL family acetyltransferase involved in cellulose biosynthesis
LRPEWEDLLSEMPGASIFSTWEWLAPWWRAYGKGRKLHVLEFRAPSGRLEGLALLSSVTRRVLGMRLRVLQLMGDGSGDSDNLDLPVRPGSEETCMAALLDYLQAQRGLWDVCEFNTMPPDSPAGQALFKDLKQRKWTRYDDATPGFVMVLPESWEAFVAQLSSNMKEQLRKVRRIERQHQVRYYRCAEASQIDAHLEVLFRLHAARWNGLGQAGAFILPERRRFYADLSRQLLARGWLEFWSMDMDGKTVAAQFHLRFRGTIYDLQGGFDPDYASFNTGRVLRANVLREAIGSGLRRYDFLGGAQEHKRRWGGQARSYTNIRFARRGSLGGLYLRTSRNANVVKDRVRCRFPRVWRAMRWLLGLKAAATNALDRK